MEKSKNNFPTTKYKPVFSHVISRFAKNGKDYVKAIRVQEASVEGGAVYCHIDLSIWDGIYLTPSNMFLRPREWRYLLGTLRGNQALENVHGWHCFNGRMFTIEGQEDGRIHLEQEVGDRIREIFLNNQEVKVLLGVADKVTQIAEGYITRWKNSPSFKGFNADKNGGWDPSPDASCNPAL